ncbi:MAG: hypothetical protein RBS16_09450 [Candidatus Cloacimonadales bacterium]|mgnify:CR=1 FL=1|jgi:hypothetical protein|nr:hypothetical protein [Candidatus Cloacimonadota bacterium]MDD3502418.1 hypothetical protein [Candidatus Cloacimonadota bacterium]MDX9978237.1 hypothetical protein [Candidatus Cloacimonadales bacterium]
MPINKRILKKIYENKDYFLNSNDERDFMVKHLLENPDIEPYAVNLMEAELRHKGIINSDALYFLPPEMPHPMVDDRTISELKREMSRLIDRIAACHSEANQKYVLKWTEELEQLKKYYSWSINKDNSSRYFSNTYSKVKKVVLSRIRESLKRANQAQKEFKT